MTVTITDLRWAHPRYFAKGNKEFFGDISYRILHGRDGQPYMVRQTYAWTDMLGAERTAHWRINPIGPAPALHILPMDTRIFATLADVQKALKVNGV